MSNELGYRGAATGSTLYFTQCRLPPSSQYWNGTSFVDYVPTDWQNYAQAMAESPANGYYYKGSPPGVSAEMPAGTYIFDIYNQDGEDPAITDELLHTFIAYRTATKLIYALPFNDNGYMMADIQSFAGSQLTSLEEFHGPNTLPFMFTVLPPALNNILRIPVSDAEGQPSSTLAHGSADLNIAIRPNTEETPTFQYSGDDIEAVTTPGTYEAPSDTGKIRFGFGTPAGMYELHLHSEVFEDADVTNLTVIIAAPDHKTTVCEVPLPAPVYLPSFMYKVLVPTYTGDGTVILPVPLSTAQGHPSAGLTHASADLQITVKANDTADPAFVYAGPDIEELTTPGDYEAPSATGKIRFGAGSLSGIYELHLHPEVFAEPAASYVVGVAAPEHKTTVGMVPIIMPDPVTTSLNLGSAGVSVKTTSATVAVGTPTNTHENTHQPYGAAHEVAADANNIDIVYQFEAGDLRPVRIVWVGITTHPFNFAVYNYSTGAWDMVRVAASLEPSQVDLPLEAVHVKADGEVQLKITLSDADGVIGTDYLAVEAFPPASGLTDAQMRFMRDLQALSLV